jgi:hypothetical protein
MHRTCAALTLTAFLVTIPVAAAGQTWLAAASAKAVAGLPAADEAAAQLTQIGARFDTRPSVLPALYVSLAALQGYDAYSTLRVVKQGAVEVNPMMRGVVGHPAAFIVVKSAATFASIYAAERLWRKDHRVTAIVLMAATTGTMAVLAAHNASVLRAQR